MIWIFWNIIWDSFALWFEGVSALVIFVLSAECFLIRLYDLKFKSFTDFGDEFVVICFDWEINGLWVSIWYFSIFEDLK